MHPNRPPRPNILEYLHRIRGRRVQPRPHIARPVRPNGDHRQVEPPEPLPDLGERGAARDRVLVLSSR